MRSQRQKRFIRCDALPFDALAFFFRQRIRFHSSDKLTGHWSPPASSYQCRKFHRKSQFNENESKRRAFGERVFVELKNYLAAVHRLPKPPNAIQTFPFQDDLLNSVEPVERLNVLIPVEHFGYSLQLQLDLDWRTMPRSRPICLTILSSWTWSSGSTVYVRCVGGMIVSDSNRNHRICHAMRMAFTCPLLHKLACFSTNICHHRSSGFFSLFKLLFYELFCLSFNWTRVGWTSSVTFSECKSSKSISTKQ